VKKASQSFAVVLVLCCAVSTAEARTDLCCRARQWLHGMLPELMGNMFRNKLAPQQRN